MPLHVCSDAVVQDSLKTYPDGDGAVIQYGTWDALEKGGSMPTIQPLALHDLNWCLRRLPGPLKDIVWKSNGKIIIAGGFIRSCITGEPISDVDCFTRTKQDASDYALLLAGADRTKIYATDNAYTVKGLVYPVQFIHRWTYDTPVALLASFDFSIAQAAIWTNTGGWQSLCGRDFYPDLAGKRLVYQAPIRDEEPGGSLLRVLKYYQRGYRIPLDSLGGVLARMIAPLVRAQTASEGQAAGTTPPRTPEQQEAYLAALLTASLREVDPDVDPNHLSHLPSAAQMVAEASHGTQNL